MTADVSMPQSANDQVEHSPHDDSSSLISLFQCLSRQTIKWNSMLTLSSPASHSVSMPQSANDQVEPVANTMYVIRFALVSMPQSANDQVERASTSTRAAWRSVSMPQSANDQVELPGIDGQRAVLISFNASVGKRSSGTAESSDD